MKERPILFSGSMVRAILSGSKSQTRRVVKPQPVYVQQSRGICSSAPDWSHIIKCPYGQPRDRLWVRENCQGWVFDSTGESVVRFEADGKFEEIENSPDSGDRWTGLYHYRGKHGAMVPSIHMPRWASRILLEIISIRVERLQDISQADAQAEGWNPLAEDGKNPAPLDPKSWYQMLWNQINGAKSWDADPWVWVIEFRRI